HCLLQDGLYLNGYSRSMARLAGRTENRDEARFWATSAATVITEEEQMQQALLAEPALANARADILAGSDEPEPSPSTLGYVSFLLAGAPPPSDGVGGAGGLPFSWGYALVGKGLGTMAGGITPKAPHQHWNATHCGPEI